MSSLSFAPNLAPLLAEIAQVKASVSSAQTAIENVVNNQNTEVKTKIDELGVVNGQISTEVTAINTHTTSKADQLAALVSEVKAEATAAKNNAASANANAIAAKRVKRVLRYTVSVSGTAKNVTIPAVTMGKTHVQLNTNIGHYGIRSGSSSTTIVDSQEITAKLINSTTVQVNGAQFGMNGANIQKQALNVEFEVVEEK